jgi:putative drug exporter of the RND superfamily
MSSHQSASRFYRLGAFAHRRRWWVLAAWIVAVVALGPQLAAITERMSSGGFEVPGSQSDRVTLAIERDFSDQFQFSDLLVLHSEQLPATDPVYRAVFEKARDALLAGPGVGAVSDPYESPDSSISPDGHTLTARVGLTDDQDQALKHTHLLETAVKEAAEGAPVTALLTGAAPMYREFQDTATHDLESAEKIALPIALVILLVAFGSLVAAGMPLIMAALGLAVAFGLISILAANTTVSIFTQNLAAMIGLGVGIDFSLFILTRFRERLKSGAEVAEAVAVAIATSGKAVFVSGMTTAVALSGTLLVNLAAFRSMGLGAMIAVGIATAAALTLLPALISIFGHRVNALRVRRNREEDGAVWRRWSGLVMRRPWPALVGGFAIIAVLTAPALDLRLSSSGISILSPDAEPRIASEIAADAFGEGQVAPAQILVEHHGGVLGEGFSEVRAVAREIASDPEVLRVDSIATLVDAEAPDEAALAAASSPEAAPLVSSVVSPDGNSTILSAVTRRGAQAAETGDFVKRMRAELPAVAGQSASVLVGGDPGLEIDINSELSSKLPYVVGLVLTLSFFVLLLFLRSLLLPIKAIVLNLASVTAAYGLLVLVFQKGYGASLLGFEAEGYIEPFLPLFLFCILFGLSMDYEVFLLSRIREEYARTGDNTEAVGWGLQRTARIITSAAAIMVAVFGAFAATTLIPIKAMGFGLAVAIFVDASLIRLVLVPATMRLLGDRNWWLPGWLDRLLPHFALGEAGEPDATPEVVDGQPAPAPVAP